MKQTRALAGLTTLTALGLAFAIAPAHATITIVAGFDFENLPTLASGYAQAPASILADQGADSGKATLSPKTGSFAGISADKATPGYAYITPGDDTDTNGTLSSTPSKYALRLGIGTSSPATAPPSNNGSTLVFNASTVGFSGITVSYDTYASSASAFQTQTFGYSANGTTFTTLTPISVPAQSKPGSDPAGYTTETFNLAGISGIAEDPNAKFEIVFSGAPAYTGSVAPNDRLDNVFVSGTADSISPAPEPSEYATLELIAFGLGALAFRARKRAAAAL